MCVELCWIIQQLELHIIFAKKEKGSPTLSLQETASVHSFEHVMYVMVMVVVSVM